MLIKNISLLFLSLIVTASLYAQNGFRTEILNEDIKTLQIKVNDDPLALPIIELGSTDVLTFEFDEMSHEGKQFYYIVRHLNYDWTKSSLAESEYISGFANGYIDQSELSVSTTFLYTHYTFNLPNDDIRFNVSGNYLVDILETSDTQNPVARACFSVVEPKVDITAKVRGNTDTEINRTKQQIDFEVNLAGYPVQDAHSEIKAVIRQNNRIDNQKTVLQPAFYNGNILQYINNKALIFEGGNEYRRFDFSSIYNYDERVETIQFDRPYYHVFLAPSQVKNGLSYISNFDVNGKFVVNYQNGFNSNTDADYMFVHFYLPARFPLEEGNIYIGGEWNYNLLNANSLMKYNTEHQLYYQTILLKQGGYNFQYWYLTKDADFALTAPIEGSHWQTQNEYTIYIYHRPWGGRYDRLIGVKVL